MVKNYLSKRELRRLCSEMHHYFNTHGGHGGFNNQDVMSALNNIHPHKVFTDRDYYDDDDVKYTLQALVSKGGKIEGKIETICVSEREKTERTNTNLSVGQFNIPISNNCECKNCDNNRVEYPLIEEYAIDENGVVSIDYSNQGELSLALLSSEYGFDSVRISDTIQKMYNEDAAKMPSDSIRLEYLNSINPPHASDIKILYALSHMGDRVDIDNFVSNMDSLTRNKSIVEMADCVSSLPEEELIRCINASETIPANYENVFGKHGFVLDNINEHRAAVPDRQSLYDEVDLLDMSGRDCMFTVSVMFNGKFKQAYSLFEDETHLANAYFDVPRADIVKANGNINALYVSYSDSMYIDDVLNALRHNEDYLKDAISDEFFLYDDINIEILKPEYAPACLNEFAITIEDKNRYGSTLNNADVDKSKLIDIINDTLKLKVGKSLDLKPSNIIRMGLPSGGGQGGRRGPSGPGGNGGGSGSGSAAAAACTSDDAEHNRYQKQLAAERAKELERQKRLQEEIERTIEQMRKELENQNKKPSIDFPDDEPGGPEIMY